jgi:hypothetical protein
MVVLVIIMRRLISLIFICQFSDRYTERGAQKIKRTDAAIANKPPIDELAGTRVFRE